MTTAQAKNKWGIPSPENEGKYMVVWQVPDYILSAFSHVRFSAVGTIGFPKKIYCNKELWSKLEAGLQNLIHRGLSKELKTWDGCFILRNQRGSSAISMHAWGAAFDVNALENGLGKVPKLSSNFVKAFTDAGLVWGGNWQRKDGMHFELK